jgi:twitching motility two-component system response regulator PilH
MKILLVDDDVDICQLTKTVLVKNGHEVWAFGTAEEGVAYARTTKPNLILMDVMLPGLSGPEIIQEIKNEQQFKDVPVVFLTGLVTGQETKEDEGMAVGGVRYPTLGKPYEIEQLLDIVKRYAK